MTGPSRGEEGEAEEEFGGDGRGEAATNSAPSADSYAEYLAAAAAAAALTRGDGRSPGSLANLVTCFMRGVGICGFSDGGICTAHTHTSTSPTRRTDAIFVYP